MEEICEDNNLPKHMVHTFIAIKPSREMFSNQKQYELADMYWRISVDQEKHLYNLIQNNENLDK